MTTPPVWRNAVPRQAPRVALQTLLSVGAFTLLYGFCFIAIDAGLAFAPPLRFAGLRALIAGCALFAVALWRREPLQVAPGRRVGVLSLALLSTTLAYAAMFLTPGRAGLGVASVLANLQPLYTLVLAAVFLGERITRGKLIVLLIGGIGVTLIAYPGLASPNAYGPTGTFLALTASGAAAAGSVLFKRIATRGALLTTAAWQLTLGSLPLFALSAIIERDESIHWTGLFIGVLLFLALFGTAFATALWYWLLERNEVGHLSLFLFVVPAFGLALAVLGFGERVSVVEGTGVGLILVAIVAALLPIGVSLDE